MANLEYQCTFVDQSWMLPTDADHPYRKVTYGFWMRETIDKILDRGTSEPGYTEWDMIHKIYQPLGPGEIRVLVLNPGLPITPLTGSLQAVTLADAALSKSYEALSYVWGRRLNSADLHLNDRRITVGENLAAALYHLRSPNEPRMLWIDAICINQSDYTEKATQVSIMIDIYKTASRVLIWLGQETEHSFLGMRVLGQLSQGTALGATETWHDLPPSVVRPGLADILERPYFRRFWVVQEAAVAKEVTMICGTHEISWSNRISSVLGFLRAVKVAVVSPQWENATLNQVDMDLLLQLLHIQLDSGPDSEKWAHRQRGPDILDFAHSMRHREATDRRDRIYALLGLVGNSTATADLRPDYTKSIEQTFSEFVEVVTRQTEEMCAGFATSDMDGGRLSSAPDTPAEKQTGNSRSAGDAQRPNPTFRVGKRDAKNANRGKRGWLSLAVLHSVKPSKVLISFRGSPNVTTPAARSPAHNSLSFAEAACAQAIEHVRSGDVDKALRHLDTAATLLRSEKYSKIA